MRLQPIVQLFEKEQPAFTSEFRKLFSCRACYRCAVDLSPEWLRLRWIPPTSSSRERVALASPRSTRRARTPERFCCPFESRALSVGIDHPAYVGPSRIAQEWQSRGGGQSWGWFPSPAPRTQPCPLAKDNADRRLHPDTSFGVSRRSLRRRIGRGCQCAPSSSFSWKLHQTLRPTSQGLVLG